MTDAFLNTCIFKMDEKKLDLSHETCILLFSFANHVDSYLTAH